jgi:hypothetical protein
MARKFTMLKDIAKVINIAGKPVAYLKYMEVKKE